MREPKLLKAERSSYIIAWTLPLKGYRPMIRTKVWKYGCREISPQVDRVIRDEEAIQLGGNLMYACSVVAPRKGAIAEL